MSMTLGFLFSSKRYSKTQLVCTSRFLQAPVLIIACIHQAAALMVSFGVLTTTTAKPAQSASSAPASVSDVREYTLGIICLALSLLTSGILGLFQERAFAKHG